MRKQELHPRTAIVNQKQKHESKASRLEALKWLAQRFPKAFDNSVQFRPLKKGIINEVLEHAEEAAIVGISKSKLREAVVIFARRVDYLTTLKAQEKRIDLNGEPVAEVTEEEAEKATLRIKRRVEKSIKSAKKSMSNQGVPSPVNTKIVYPSSRDDSYDRPTYYSNGASESDIQSTSSFKSKAVKSSVVIKHKSPKQYDPDAVARLKEKLGLSRKEETVE